MSLSMNPGHTAFTVTPRPANSLAMDMVMPITPALRGCALDARGSGGGGMGGGDQNKRQRERQSDRDK